MDKIIQMGVSICGWVSACCILFSSTIYIGSVGDRRNSDRPFWQNKPRGDVDLRRPVGTSRQAAAARESGAAASLARRNACRACSYSQFNEWSLNLTGTIYFDLTEIRVLNVSNSQLKWLGTSIANRSFLYNTIVCRAYKILIVCLASPGEMSSNGHLFLNILH